MDQSGIIRRAAVFIAIVAGAGLAFALGLAVMNIRSDLALAGGGLICVAAPVIGGVLLWAQLSKGGPQP